MNDAHDNDKTDKEMLEKYVQGSAFAAYKARDAGYPNWDMLLPQAIQEYRKRGEPDGVVRKKIDPIHSNPHLQHIDVRLYFDKFLDREYMLTKISEALTGPATLHDMVSAYELVNDGFAHLTPNDRPLA